MSKAFCKRTAPERQLCLLHRRTEVVCQPLILVFPIQNGEMSLTILVFGLPPNPGGPPSHWLRPQQHDFAIPALDLGSVSALLQHLDRPAKSICHGVTLTHCLQRQFHCSYS